STWTDKSESMTNNRRWGSGKLDFGFTRDCDSISDYEMGTGLSREEPRQYDGLEAMPVIVRLKDIVDALEMQFDESSSFLDLDSGQVELVTHDLLRQAEEPDDDEKPDLPACQTREWE